ncbi:hypothetical protein B7463_g1524, partial [Scytalidium lignicola]
MTDRRKGPLQGGCVRPLGTTSANATGLARIKSLRECSTDFIGSWLNDSQVWSCRIKLPQSPSDQHKTIEDNSTTSDHHRSALGKPMDLSIGAASPGNKDQMEEPFPSLANMNSRMEVLELPTDPDAQATVTDFLDFTEYLPSDMIRSLTLVGKLDQTYRNSSASVHELTSTLGQLPQLPVDGKPDPIILREDISENLSEAVRSRTLSHAEACRMADNVERHYNRAKAILSKLQAMAEAYPPTREPTPVEEKSKSPQAARGGPKITLRLDGGGRPQENGTIRVRKHRIARITVPGEVLAPYELDYESYFSDSEEWNSEDDDFLTPRHTPGRSMGGNSGRIKLKLPKKEKIKTPKSRTPRAPGMGTNVHSSVAGISTSNALAKLKPPPENAVLGSEDAPWLQLTAWELAKLRKRMKKNAVWSPSDTMIARELKSLGRGIEAYRLAKQKAESAGQPFESAVTTTSTDNGTGKKVLAEGAISVDALGTDEIQLSNRGMKLNEAKKLKRENEAKELAKLAAEEAEESARKMAEAAQVMKGLFNRPTAKNATEEKKSSVKTPAKISVKKRKRESSPEIDIDKDKDKDKDKEKEKENEEEKPSTDAAKTIRPQLKRTKTETPVPPPRTTAANANNQVTPVPTESTTLSVSPTLVPSTILTDVSPIPPPVLSPKKSSTPILPPAKEIKRDQPSANTRRRGSLAPTPTPAPEPLPPRRPDSSRGKAASTEPVATTATTASTERARRSSTARNTPAPEPRAPSKRSKKPAPGVVTGGIEGSASVSVGRRAAAPRKKAYSKKRDGREGSATADAEVDDEGNLIDPNEARYCLCNRVSFGMMIACENNDCDKEWFHLECVGLTEPPARTTKWYCPECRVILGIGEKGEVNARGKKK